MPGQERRTTDMIAACVCACARVCVRVRVCVMETLWWSSAVLICQSHLIHSTDIIYTLQNQTQNINETDWM